MLFVMFFAWFWKGLDRWQERKDQPERLVALRSEEREVLPTGDIVYADDANFLSKHEAVTQDKVDYVSKKVKNYMENS